MGILLPMFLCRLLRLDRIVLLCLGRSLALLLSCLRPLPGLLGTVLLGRSLRAIPVFLLLLLAGGVLLVGGPMHRLLRSLVVLPLGYVSVASHWGLWLIVSGASPSTLGVAVDCPGAAFCQKYWLSFSLRFYGVIARVDRLHEVYRVADLITV